MSSNPTDKASTPSTKLPEALEPVRDRLRTLLEEGSHEDVIELVVSCLIQLHQQNTELVLELERIRRERLGKRSEQLSSNQLWAKPPMSKRRPIGRRPRPRTRH